MSSQCQCVLIMMEEWHFQRPWKSEAFQFKPDSLHSLWMSFFPLCILFPPIQMSIYTLLPETGTLFCLAQSYSSTEEKDPTVIKIEKQSSLRPPTPTPRSLGLAVSQHLRCLSVYQLASARKQRPVLCYRLRSMRRMLSGRKEIG